MLIYRDPARASFGSTSLASYSRWLDRGFDSICFDLMGGEMFECVVICDRQRIPLKRRGNLPFDRQRTSFDDRKQKPTIHLLGRQPLGQ